MAGIHQRGVQPSATRLSTPSLDDNDAAYQQLVNRCLFNVPNNGVSGSHLTTLVLPNVRSSAVNENPLAPKGHSVIVSRVEPEAPSYPSNTLWLNTNYGASTYKLFHVNVCVDATSHTTCWLPVRDVHAVHYPCAFIEHYCSLAAALLRAGSVHLRVAQAEQVQVSRAPALELTEVTTQLPITLTNQRVMEIPGEPAYGFAVRLTINSAEYRQGQDFIRSGHILNWTGPFELDPHDTVVCSYLTYTESRTPQQS